MDHADRGPTFHLDSDKNRIERHSMDERFSSIDRIKYPPDPRIARGSSPFLAYNRVRWKGLLNDPTQFALGSFVDSSHRGAVRLDLRLNASTERFKSQPASGMGGISRHAEQLRQ